MVEDCASLATQAAAELEQLTRAEVLGAGARARTPCCRARRPLDARVGRHA